MQLYIINLKEEVLHTVEGAMYVLMHGSMIPGWLSMRAKKRYRTERIECITKHLGILASTMSCSTVIAIIIRKAGTSE